MPDPPLRNAISNRLWGGADRGCITRQADAQSRFQTGVPSQAGGSSRNRALLHGQSLASGPTRFDRVGLCVVHGFGQLDFILHQGVPILALQNAPSDARSMLASRPLNRFQLWINRDNGVCQTSTTTWTWFGITTQARKR